jgi:tripartite-type tricarboxylate transporter receptor subunit TctC
LAEALFWNVLLAPPGTPREIVEKIHAAFEQTIKDKPLMEAWAKTGVDLYPPRERTPDGAHEYLRQEFARWTRTIQEYKIEGLPQ